MTHDPRTLMRRKDRAVTDEAWIRAFLHRAPVGVLATAEDAQPFITNNLFAYDETAHCLIMHTALKGRARTVIEANPRVCFSVMEMGRLLPAAESLEFSVEYASVVVFGRAYIVADHADATRYLQLLMDKYAPHLTPGQDYRPPVDSEVRRTSVFRIDIEAWSGKKKEAAADFPGAYWYASPPMLASLAARGGEDESSVDDSITF